MATGDLVYSKTPGTAGQLVWKTGDGRLCYKKVPWSPDDAMQVTFEGYLGEANYAAFGGGTYNLTKQSDTYWRYQATGTIYGCYYQHVITLRDHTTYWEVELSVSATCQSLDSGSYWRKTPRGSDPYGPYTHFNSVYRDQVTAVSVAASP